MYDEIEINSDRWFDLKLFENEKFESIPEYEELYKISNYGRVKRILFKNNKCCIEKEKILSCLKHDKNKNSYLMVTLTKNGQQKTKYIHRLVAQVFIENPNNYDEVNHKNENKSDNRVENLEYCNHLYNMSYGTILKRKSSSMKRFYKNKKES